MNVAEHLELHLGRMSGGWSSADASGVQVCHFCDSPKPGLTTIATLGLSNTVLALADGRTVRQELLMTIGSDAEVEHIVKLLFHVADSVFQQRQALLRGEVIPLQERITERSEARALYVSMPVVFPEVIATLEDTSPPTVIVWLFPVLPAEVELIDECGWSVFEEKLEEADPALFDFERSSVV